MLQVLKKSGLSGYEGNLQEKQSLKEKPQTLDASAEKSFEDSKDGHVYFPSIFKDHAPHCGKVLTAEAVACEYEAEMDVEAKTESLKTADNIRLYE